MTYYAVGCSKQNGVGFDIGEFDNFRDALAEAIAAGGVPPAGATGDCPEITLHVPDSPGTSIWIQRIGRGVCVILLLLFVGCAGGAPLPEPRGSWEPLNGWVPPAVSASVTP